MDDCIFCRIIRGEAPAHILSENDDVIVFLALENHPLIVPKAHIDDIYGLDERTCGAVMTEAVRVARAVRDALDCDGTNLRQCNGAAAGQSVFHFHLHIKPRWTGDDVMLRGNTRPADETERRQMARKLAGFLR